MIGDWWLKYRRFTRGSRVCHATSAFVNVKTVAVRANGWAQRDAATAHDEQDEPEKRWVSQRSEPLK